MAVKQLKESENSNEDVHNVNKVKVIQQQLNPFLPQIDPAKNLEILTNIDDEQKTVPDNGKETTRKVNKRPEELPWRITPSLELNKLVSHYLMLSKIRLTCEYFIDFLKFT